MIIRENSREIIEEGGRGALAERQRLMAGACRELSERMDRDDPHDMAGELGKAIIYELMTGEISGESGVDIQAIRLAMDISDEGASDDS